MPTISLNLAYFFLVYLELYFQIIQFYISFVFRTIFPNFTICFALDYSNKYYKCETGFVCHANYLTNYHDFLVTLSGVTEKGETFDPEK